MDKNEEGEEFNSSPFFQATQKDLVADWGAGRACARARGVRADYAGLIGVIHVLSGRGRGYGCSRAGVRLVARARRIHKGVTALGTSGQHKANHVSHR